MRDRFYRTELLLGKISLDRLHASHVTVCGLGAVGSYAVEGLARAGIGHLCLVDFDVVQASNINRQLYALESTVGRKKADVAFERVKDIHPDCAVEALDCFVDGETVNRVLDRRPDVVIDAIDSVGPKTELLASAVERGLSVISCMGAATRTDPFAIRVSDIGDTQWCPLARIIRKRLRRRGITRGVQCVYSVETSAKATELEPPPEVFDRGRPRRPLGSLSFITGIFGLVAAREAVRVVLGR
jgi:tRNA A37 threonylcarbamoyladenosine dehydratase